MHLGQFDPYQRTGGLFSVRGTVTGLKRVAIEAVCLGCRMLCPGKEGADRSQGICRRGYVCICVRRTGVCLCVSSVWYAVCALQNASTLPRTRQASGASSCLRCLSASLPRWHSRRSPAPSLPLFLSPLRPARPLPRPPQRSEGDFTGVSGRGSLGGTGVPRRGGWRRFQRKGRWW